MKILRMKLNSMYFLTSYSCEMRDMGSYKCHFKNATGEDETTGKVTVKPVSYFLITMRYFLKVELYKFTMYQNCTALKLRLELLQSGDFTCDIFYRQHNQSKLNLKLRYGILSASQPEKISYF